jgi:hypothetical protein
LWLPVAAASPVCHRAPEALTAHHSSSWFRATAPGVGRRSTAAHTVRFC